jgi:hypothetical protein
LVAPSGFGHVLPVTIRLFFGRVSSTISLSYVVTLRRAVPLG